MSIEKVRDFFGIKYLIPYDLVTLKPMAIFRAIGEVAFENTIDAVELTGGNTEAPYDVEFGQPSPTLTGTLREYPAEVYDLLEVSTITQNAAQTSGNVSSPTNGQGTSVFKSPNGISAVTVSAATSLIFGRYTLVATGAQTLSLYVAGLSDALLDMQGLIVSGISTTTSGSVAIAAAGITLTVNGTPSYTVGDSCYFEVQPINTGSTSILVGYGAPPAAFGLRCVFPRKTDGVLHFIDLFNVVGRGLPWKGTSREFSEFDFTWKPLARSSDGAVYQMVRVLGSTS